jgi:uncharacterized protein (DUF427 family)
MENVWDYPRPPAVDRCTRRVRIELGGVTIADSTRALRVLETSHPPTIYIPPQDVADRCLTPAISRRTYCEWKGWASYFDVAAGTGEARSAAWAYAAPTAGYESITDHVAFYPGRMNACWLDEERVQAQPGDFYGGWLTGDIQGPVKGGPATSGW